MQPVEPIWWDQHQGSLHMKSTLNQSNTVATAELYPPLAEELRVLTNQMVWVEVQNRNGRLLTSCDNGS